MKLKFISLIILVLFLVSGCAGKIAEGDGQIAEDIEGIGKDAQADENVQVSEGALVSPVVVRLTEQKTMDPDELHISKGDTVKWVNTDKNFNHNLVIYPAEIERPTAKDIIVQSGNIAPSSSWDYTFEESGTYAVKDIYSGTMRGEITAEVTADISEAEIIGTVSVE